MRAAVLAVWWACAGAPPTPPNAAARDTIDLHPTAADHLAEARELEATARMLHVRADQRLAWLVAAAGWDRVVIDGALPKAELRDAATRALYAIRIARDPRETPTPGAVPPPRVLREVLAIDRHVALLDEPDGPDALHEQFEAAQLLATWNDWAGARPRLEHILGVRRDLDLAQPAVELLLRALGELHDDAGTRSWLVILTSDPAFVHRFPAAAETARRQIAQLDFDDASAMLARGDFAGCAAAFERVATALPRADAAIARYDDAICLERDGQRYSAIVVYNEVLAYFPDSPVAEQARKRLAQLKP
jgi:tetratricopeptide (TPR) repeat protein